MPKKSLIFSDRVEAFFPRGTRVQLMAISYHMGARGDMSVPARNFLLKGLQEYVSSLKGQALKDYQEILENVQVAHENQKSPS